MANVIIYNKSMDEESPANNAGSMSYARKSQRRIWQDTGNGFFVRTFLLILIMVLLSCTNNTKNTLNLISHVWINQDLKFDTTYEHSDSSMYSIYGSGTLLLLDTNHTLKSFTNTFINNNDSIAWGEPGIILFNGSWKEKGANIVAIKRLFEKTFELSSDTIGQITIDRYEIRGDTLIRNKRERFVPVGLLTQELKAFLYSDWSKFEKKPRT